MRKLILQEFTTADGVAQAPGGPEEDTSGGFAHGGWSMEYVDDAGRQLVEGNLAAAGGYVLGRRTYEIFAGYWPNASEDQAVIRDPLNAKPKYVASTTLSEPLAWENSHLLGGDVPAAVRALKEEDGGDLIVMGSTKLVQTLVQNDLVDEYQLMIDPVLVGGGKRLFPDDGVLRRLRLIDATVADSGVIIATYGPARSDG
jgi:dihydrofolate reductase